MSLIEVRHVDKSFPTPNGPKLVLSDISFEVSRGRFLSVFGPNGSGKSTLMSILAGLERPDNGVVDVTLSRSRVVPVVFQDYRRSLLPWLDVEANILYPLRLAGVPRETQRKRLERVLAFIRPSFDLGQRVSELSGGEAQLTSLLRALVVEPEVLICDEPTSALDYQASLTLVQRLMDVAAEFALTVVFVGHDLDEVIYVGDEVLFLSKRPGRVVGRLPVDFPRPRRVELQATPEFAELKAKALRLFDLCVSDNIGATG